MPDTVLHRLHSQQLLDSRFERPEEVVSWFGAVQSQDYAAAKWALAQRMQAATEAEIEKAFAEGAILRTHLLRPTWHFVSPLDIRWILQLTAPRVHAMNATYYRHHELDQAIFSRSNAVLAQALQGGRYLTRAELSSTLEKAGIPTPDYRMGYLLMYAELEGIICSGPRRGKQITYALLDERAPQARTLEREEALAELACRYFSSHGPATLQDFTWWSGLTANDARAGIEASPSPLHQEEIAGKTFWYGEPLQTNTDLPLTVHLLPNYDEFTVGYTDRSAILEGQRMETLDLNSSIVLGNIILVNGRIAGTWKRTLSKRTVIIKATTFAPLGSAEEQAFAAAALRYGEFLSLPVELDL